jgi:hypothetical protein
MLFFFSFDTKENLIAVGVKGGNEDKRSSIVQQHGPDFVKIRSLIPEKKLASMHIAVYFVGCNINTNNLNERKQYFNGSL